MTDSLGTEARELIERALREEVAADPAELARIRKAVLTAAVSAGAAAGTGKLLAAPLKSLLTSVTPLLKAALLGGVAGALAIGASVAVTSLAGEATRGGPQLPHVSRLASGSQRSVASPAPSANATSSVPAAAASSRAAPGRWSSEKRRATELGAPEAGDSTSTPRSSPSSSSDTTPKSPEDSSLARELELLERVQAALRMGDGVRALELLDRGSPEPGQLGAERLAAEVFAACQAGQIARASRAAGRLIRQHPATPTLARVRASCIGAELTGER